MIAGTVLSTDLDWWGDTLTAATGASDTVLHVATTVDFDEDGGWLVVGDSAPVVYATIDEDADTVTLASAPGAFEVGTPVYLYDPTVTAEEKRALRHVANVRLHDGRGTVTATIPHAAVPVAGVDALVGASVRLEPTDEEEDQFEVAGVVGRNPSIDSAYVSIPRGRASITAPVSIPNVPTTFIALTSLDVAFSSPDFTLEGGNLTWRGGAPVVVSAAAKASWAANSGGFRRLLIRQSAGVESDAVAQVDPDTAAATSQSVAYHFTLADGQSLLLGLKQNSGAALNVEAAELSVVVVGYR